MKLSALRYLVAFADEGSFSRAAERCQVAQPTLSVALQNLEAELGVALIEQRLIQAELAAGTLVAPFGFTAFEGGLMAVPAARQVRADMAGFVDWMRARLGQAAVLKSTPALRRKPQQSTAV